MKNLLKLASAAIAAFAVHAASAETIKVENFKYAGPYTLNKPYMVDSVNVKGKAFDFESFTHSIKGSGRLENVPWTSSIPASDSTATQFHQLYFSLQNQGYTSASIKVEGVKKYTLFVDGRKSSADVSLDPATHDVLLQYLSMPGDSLDVKLSVECEKEGAIVLRNDDRRIFSLDINTQGISCGGISLSPSGKYLALGTSMLNDKGKSEYSCEIIRLSDKKVLSRSSRRISWMPERDAYYYTRMTVGGRELVVEEPEGLKETVLCSNLPDGYFTIAPDETYLIYTLQDEGPKEGDLHQIYSPDDRQPGWRDRSYLARYDLANAVMQQLTFGYENSYLADISADSRYILFETSSQRLAKRPTSLRSLYRMDLATMEVECLVENDGFISSASFSPDGSKVLITGSPECLGGIGNICPEGRTPNMFEYELYVMNIADKAVKPITTDFIPNVSGSVWSRYDNMIYVNTEDKDCKHLYRINPANGKAERLNDRLDRVTRYDLALSSPVLVYVTQGLETADLVYCLDTKKGRDQLIRDYTPLRLDGVDMGKGDGYEFTSSRGDLINTFFVLPPNFDPARKYPMLVHYYGGCSPSTRYPIGSYSPQFYAAQGYVFLVVNPSGATGFGQEFSSRHVNTAGQGVAEDIIEAVQRFCQDHPYVDTGKIGCFSASYGGFMTQLLLTKTDIFAAGISHAGISDHTGYWGEGFWGYSYSEVSMANSYPWSHKELFVNNSPLYMADKIHTPLLFLHGSADTNVPPSESIQMFTALRLLGAETAFVMVDGENHGIAEYNKRREWLRTISAWFAKYLKDDPSWWNAMYPPNKISE